MAGIALAAAVGTCSAQSAHWSLVPPQRVVPEVRNEAWCRDDLDRCVLAHLEQHGLQPSPPASPEVLLRRVHLVLTGLPPSPDQVASFVGDPSDAAYERVVDALLADQACAEHQATPWLDLARFADTYGFQADFECRTWPWRDWLLQALHTDVPWPRFVREILAGDLLPDANVNTRTATAFWRLHRQTNEGGSIEAEWRHEYIADRVDTFGGAFLGLTLGCARCHDHKTDPIRQRDYYALGSFFAVDESGLYPYSTGGVPQPALRLTTPAQDAEITRLQAAVDAAVEAAAAAVAIAREHAESPTQPQAGIAAPQPVAVRDFDASGHLCDGDARLPIEGLPAFTRDDAFSIRLVLWCPDTKERAVLLHTSHYTQDADTQGYQLLLKDGHLCWELVHHWPGSAAAVRTQAELPLQQNVDVVVTYDGSSSARGMAVYVNGEAVPVEIVRDHLAGPSTVRQLELGGRDRDRGFAGGRFHAFAVYGVALTAAEVEALAGRSPAPETLRAHHIARATDPAAQQTLTAARKALHAYVEAIPELMVMAPAKHPEPRFVLRRGDYTMPDRQQPVGPDVPSCLPPLPPLPPDGRHHRLHLADWLAAPQHPLAARVAVDRLWAMCFGRGLTATPENFGLNGATPTQRRLLDLLAVDFAREGSNKGLLRRIVRSATFRQSSTATAAQRQADPDNEHLARGPSTRLSAEALRDQALAASGLLHRHLGGRSVKPWQPEGLWRDAGVGWGGADYKPDTGNNAHRRSLYTYRKRTAPPPNLSTFDGSSREVCTVRRQDTNTPLQALVLLGDPVFVECAAALAQQVLATTAATPERRLRQVFMSLAARAPRAAEMTAMQELAESEPDPLRALTLVATTVMASDAVVMLR